MVKPSGRMKSDLPGPISRTRWKREESDCSVKVMFIMLMMLVPSFSEWILHALLLLPPFLKNDDASFYCFIQLPGPCNCSICMSKSRLGPEECSLCSAYSAPKIARERCVSETYTVFHSCWCLFTSLWKCFLCLQTSLSPKSVLLMKDTEVIRLFVNV